MLSRSTSQSPCHPTITAMRANFIPCVFHYDENIASTFGPNHFRCLSAIRSLVHKFLGQFHGEPRSCDTAFRDR